MSWSEDWKGEGVREDVEEEEEEEGEEEEEEEEEERRMNVDGDTVCVSGYPTVPHGLFSRPHSSESDPSGEM